MSQPEWSRQLYDVQHAIWPAWSASEAGADGAVDALLAQTGLSPGSAVLDLGCGVGRQVVAFARHGFAATGIELSEALTGRARARIVDAGVAATVRQGDLLQATLQGPFDLVYSWDSTVNLFDLPTALDALARWSARVRPGGWLAVEQLYDRHWATPRGPYTLQGDAIGPGRTTRRYRFEDGRLYDEVVHEPPDGPPIELPTQVLHLYPVPELEAGLVALGLTDVRTVAGSGGAVDDAASTVLTVARVPS